MKKYFIVLVALSFVIYTSSTSAQESDSNIENHQILSENVHKLILDPLPTGTYTIGTDGYFPTIDSAFNKLSIDGIAGPVILELIDSSYTAPANNYGFLLNGPIPGTDENNRVTIKPAENKNVKIAGEGKFVFQFNNTSYLTVDGVTLTGNTTLTIHTKYNSQYNMVLGGSLSFINNSNQNVVQNITALTENTRSFGIGFILDDPQIYDAPDSNLIQNNFVKEAGLGIHISGYTSQGAAFVRPEANIISGNFVGSETDTSLIWGIQIEYCKNTVIEDNIVSNISNNTSYLGGVGLGIDSYQSIKTIIRNNIVHSFPVNNNETDVFGILLDGGGSDNLVYNNMVDDITDSSSQSSIHVAGIELSDQTNPQIYYNSVYLTGKGSHPLGSAALYIYRNCNNAKVKNNILVNTRDESPYCASSMYMYSSSILTSDNNDLYFVQNQNSCLVKVGSSDYYTYYTLEDWQKTGHDLNSVIEMPNFVEPYLHIDEKVLTYIESRGTPISGIENDIDGDMRNTTKPDIGADEFDGITSVEDETALSIKFTLKQNYPNPFNPTTNISYSVPELSFVTIKVYNILGNEIKTLVNNIKPIGNYKVEFDGSNLASSIYFYRMQAGDYIEIKKMVLMK